MFPKTMTQIEIKELPFGSTIQKESIALRTRILRTPIGFKFSDKELAAECSEFHIAALIHNKLVGILLLKPISKNEIKMRQVAIDTDMQNKGIGTRLIEFAENLAKSEGYQIMSLHARETAVPFYLKANYKIEGKSFIEVGLPHYQMTKIL